MKIYQVGIRDNDDSHMGYLWHSNKKDAIQAWKENANDKGPQPEDFDHFYLKLTKEGVLKFLNAYCSNPNNG